VVWQKVSPEGALRDYGVVLTGELEDLGYDAAATEETRAARRAERPQQPFFDRGPGYARLAGGALAAEVDWV
jgi:N-methylhydantoinase B